MEELRVVIDVGKMRRRVTYKVDAQGNMRLELRKREREQVWWKSGWIRDRERLGREVRKK